MYTKQEFGLMRRKVKGGKVWYYWVYDEDGKRIYRSTGKTTKGDALKYVLERRDKHMLGVIDRKSITFNMFCEDMFIWDKCPIVRHKQKRGRKISFTTIKLRRNHLVHHILPAFGNLPVSKITSDKLDKWLIEMSMGSLSNTTSNSVMSTMSEILEHAVREGLLNENPTKKVEKLGNDSKRHESFTISEVRKILEGGEEGWSSPIVRVMCMTAAVTGMRMGEVRALTYDKIVDGCIRVNENITDGNILKDTKNGEERLIPIPEMLKKELDHLAPVNGGFIFSLDGYTNPITHHAVNKSLKKRCETVGVEYKSFHSFRAFFNTMLTSSNVNETVVRSVIGHKDEEMTEHYFHLETADVSMISEVQMKILA